MQAPAAHVRRDSHPEPAAHPPDTVPRAREEGEGISPACGERDRHALSAAQERAERVDDVLGPFLDHLTCHAFEKIVDMLPFLGFREPAREADHNRVVPENGSGMLVSRSLNPVAERVVGHRKNAIVQGRSILTEV